MRGWFVFAVMVVLVFGPLLLDELSRLRVRRETGHKRPLVRGPISLVPEDDEQIPLQSHDVAPVRTKKKEYAA